MYPEILSYPAYIQIQQPVAIVFTTNSGRLANRYYALPKGTRDFDGHCLFGVFSVNLHIWRPFPCLQPGDPVDGSYLYTTNTALDVENHKVPF